MVAAGCVRLRLCGLYPPRRRGLELPRVLSSRNGHGPPAPV